MVLTTLWDKVPLTLFYRNGVWDSEAREWSSWDTNIVLPDPKVVVLTPFNSFESVCYPVHMLSNSILIIVLLSLTNLCIQTTPSWEPCSPIQGVRTRGLKLVSFTECFLCVMAELGAGRDRDEVGEYPVFWSTKSRYAPTADDPSRVWYSAAQMPPPQRSLSLASWLKKPSAIVHHFNLL